MRMEDYFTCLLPKNAILAGIIYHTAVFPSSIIITYFVFLICLGYTNENLARNHNKRQQVHSNRKPSRSPNVTTYPNSALLGTNMTQKLCLNLEEKTGERCAEICVLSEIREVYKNCGVEEACVLDKWERSRWAGFVSEASERRVEEHWVPGIKLWDRWWREVTPWTGCETFLESKLGGSACLHL